MQTTKQETGFGCTTFLKLNAKFSKKKQVFIYNVSYNVMQRFIWASLEGLLDMDTSMLLLL